MPSGCQQTRSQRQPAVMSVLFVLCGKTFSNKCLAGVSQLRTRPGSSGQLKRSKSLQRRKQKIV